MCGIAGYVGTKDAEPILLVALERLKYRGYDSSGVCVNDDGDLLVRKAAGKLRELEAKLATQPVGGRCGIGHTRWATHGAPNAINAHPHTASLNGGEPNVAVVTNGIVENHETIKRQLIAEGVVFETQTDCEVIPHLLAKHYNGDPIAAIQTVVPLLEGSFAFCAVFADQPQRILVARQGAPLLLGRGRGENLVASDLPALLPHASESCAIEDGWIADLTADDISICDMAGHAVSAEFTPVEVSVDQVTRGDYDSFMAKEIAEQPEVLARIIESRLHGGRLVDPDLGLDLKQVNHIVFLACGTSWHAALLGKRFLEQLARVHVEVDISSEYRYRNPVASGDTLVVAISQSGETADTLAGLRLARSKFIPVVSLVNVVDSTIARESDGVLPLLAGPEIGVASTKAYTAQILALYLFAIQVARAKGRLTEQDLAPLLDGVQAVPQQITDTLSLCESSVEQAADIFTPAVASVFLGRGGEYVTALEGALKLKEIAYVFATGYAAGEFKHGPIALVTQNLPLICPCPRDALREKMLSNIQEVRARAGRIITVGAADDEELADLCDMVFPVLSTQHQLLQPLLTILPLQRYAYHVARNRGCDVDQPRNLAKSVTVE